MLRHLSDILKADLDPAVLEDPSKLRIDYVGVCHVLLDLLQWHVQQPPDENPSQHRALVNAWNAVLRDMSKILMALNPAVGLDADSVRPLLPKIKMLGIPPEMKPAIDELLSTLQTICLGSAVASRAISHWEGVMAASRRSLRSGYGSEHDDAILKDAGSQADIIASTFDGITPILRVAQNGVLRSSDSPTGSNSSSAGTNQVDGQSLVEAVGNSDVTLSP